MYNYEYVTLCVVCRYNYCISRRRRNINADPDSPEFNSASVQLPGLEDSAYGEGNHRYAKKVRI